MTTLALFNCREGTGTTTLAYHLSTMASRLSQRVLVVDLDPQAHLTSRFLPEQDIEEMWAGTAATVAHAVALMIASRSEIAPIAPREIDENLWLLPGDLTLSRCEEQLARAWQANVAGDNSDAVRTSSAFHSIIAAAATEVQADIVIVDVGPSLTATVRAALLAADHVLVPLTVDPFSLHGLRTLGPPLREWRHTWQETVLPRLPADIGSPRGEMAPLGYVITQPSVRLDRPVRALDRWMREIPAAYAESVLGAPGDIDPGHLVGTVRNYASLATMSRDARKPMFDLLPADGATSSIQRYVSTWRQDFTALTRAVLDRLVGSKLTGAPR